MNHRELEPLLVELAGQEPVLALTGPRQAGQTTLCRAAFPGKTSVSLEALDTRGPDGHSPPELREHWDHIGLGIETLADVPTAFRGFLNRAGFRGRRESPAPLVYSKLPGEAPRPPTRRDMATIVWCLSGLFAALDKGLLHPSPISRGQPIPRFDVAGTPGQPEVHVHPVPWEQALGVGDLLTDLELTGDAGPSAPEEPDQPPVEDPSTL